MGTIARSDVELVEASRRGEQEAFGHLVARYQDVVCAVSYSSTGDQVLSEDVAQETFIAAWRQLDRLRDSVRLRPWLCGIARNLARKARKRRRREELVDADEQVAAGASPFDDAARGQVERIVREALARIPEAYREVLVLYYRENQSIREVAETLGMREEAVMQRLSRGRRYLADSVSELVERSLRADRRQRDLVAAVLASIAVLAIPARVDASPPKGSTMLKLALAASAAVAAGTTAYLVHAHHGAPTRTASPARPAAPATLHYGAGTQGLAHAPTLGPTAAPRAIASRNVAASDLALLPADADAVIGVNFAQLRGSALWQRFVAPALHDVPELREFETVCGFDPLASLGSVSMGIKGLGNDDNVTGVIVIHGYEKAKSMSCFDKQGLDGAEKDGWKVTVDGGVVLMTDAKGTEHAAFTFSDETTALLVLGPDAASRESVERIAAGTSTLASSPAFSDALQAINTDDSVWLMISDHSPLVGIINTAMTPYTPIRLGTAYLSMNVTDTLALDAGLRLGSPETVAALVATIQAKLGGREAEALKTYFDQLDVLADGSDLIVSIALTGDQLLKLAASMSAHGDITVSL